MIRIILGDDHRIVREGLKQILADAPDVCVAGDAQPFNIGPRSNVARGTGLGQPTAWRAIACRRVKVVLEIF